MWGSTLDPTAARPNRLGNPSAQSAESYAVGRCINGILSSHNLHRNLRNRGLRVCAVFDKEE